MSDFEPLNPKKLVSLYGKSVVTKKFSSIDELTQYLENQMIVARLKDIHQQQLDYIDRSEEHTSELPVTATSRMPSSA